MVHPSVGQLFFKCMYIRVRVPLASQGAMKANFGKKRGKESSE